MKEETRREIESTIPVLAKEKIQKGRNDGSLVFPDIDINGFPPGFQTMVLSSAIATDALTSYELKDGDVFEYINWFLDSSIKILHHEICNRINDETAVLLNPMNFYRKLSLTYEKTKDVRKAEEELNIPENDVFFNKSLKIYEDRIL